LNQKTKILIELPTWLGDSVMTTPAIENIVKFYGNCEIIFIGSESSVELMKFHPNCCGSLILNRNIKSFISSIRSIKPVDIFISFRSSIRTKLFFLFLRSEKKYQFNKNKFTDGHQVEKYNQFVKESLGIRLKAGKLKIYNPPYLRTSKNPLLGINPGASYGSAKCWPYKNFVEVILSLSRKFDILIFGGPNEIFIADKIVKDLKKNNCTNFENLSGKTSISDLVGHISTLDIFITGDSGPMHIAAAFQIPTVSIFGPTKINETSQWLNNKTVVLKKDLTCQPCMKRVCPLGHHDCMKKISSKDVINSVLNLI